MNGEKMVGARGAGGPEMGDGRVGGGVERWNGMMGASDPAEATADMDVAQAPHQCFTAEKLAREFALLRAQVQFYVAGVLRFDR